VCVYGDGEVRVQTSVEDGGGETYLRRRFTFIPHVHHYDVSLGTRVQVFVFENILISFLGRDNLVLRLSERIVLKWIWKELGVKVWIAFIWSPG
jgi:hypothetical protein